MTSISLRLAFIILLSLCGSAGFQVEPAVAAGLPATEREAVGSTQENRKTSLPQGMSSKGAIALTEEERAWLKSHPVIRVVQDPGWPPVEFTDERGMPAGMTYDYLALIEDRLGVKFERVLNLNWQDAYARLQRWEIDMTTSVAVTPERTKFWRFTEPYMKIPIVILAQGNVTYIAGMHELDGKKVAAVDGYAVSDWIPRDYPGIRIVKVRDAMEGLRLLQRGDVFAYVDNMLVVGYYLAKLKMANVKIAGETPYVNAQAMAVRKDWPIFAGILQKALDSISEGERAEIYHKWLPIRYEHGFDYSTLWQVLAVFALIVLILIAWNRKLSVEIRNRRAAEVALSKSERQFRQLFDNAAVPLCLVNREGMMVDFNRHFHEAFGYTREDLPTLNEWWQRAYPDPEYRRRVVKTWEQAVRRATEEKTDIEPIEYFVTRKDGDVRTVLISGTILGDDYLATLFDVTERSQAERALKESEQLLRSLVETSSDWIWRVDETGVYTYASQRVKDLLGYEPDEIEGKTPFDLMPHEEAERVSVLFREIVESRKPFSNLENVNLHRDGTQKVIETNGAPIFDREGKFSGYIGFDRDITQRRLAQDRLKASLHEKEILLRELYHRARNNMQVICSLLSLKAAAVNDVHVVGILKEMENRIHSMALVHHKLYESGDLSHIPLDGYVADLAALLLRSYNVKPEDIALTLEMDPITVSVDVAIPCGLILNELISNSLIHAFPDGKEAEIHIRLSRGSGEMVELAISDNGVGVPSDFDFRGNGALGLATILALGEDQLEGTVSFESLEGFACRLVFPNAPFRIMM